MKKKVNIMKDMTKDEFIQALREFPVILLPLGAREQHGHHLPLGTDIYLTEYLSTKVAEETGALVAPAMPFGYSWVWRDTPGTITLQQHLMEEIIKDVAKSVVRYGTKLLVLINGHDANNASMKYAIRELADETKLTVLSLFYPKLSDALNAYCESKTWNGMIHACEFETSLMLKANPELVQMDKAVKEYPPIPPLYNKSSLSLGSLSESGVFGDATAANEQKGNHLFQHFINEIVSIIQYTYDSLA